jgi:hypothetical protein
MAKYHMREWQVLCASVAGAEPPQGNGPLNYARMNKMVAFVLPLGDFRLFVIFNVMLALS